MIARLGLRCSEALSMAFDGHLCVASCRGAGSWGTGRRWAQSQASGADNPGPSSPDSASRTASTSTSLAASGDTGAPGAPGTASPTAAPPLPTSPETQALAEQLRKSSPTGRLIDLFTQTAPGRQPAPLPGLPSVSGVPAAAEAAAEAPLSPDSDVVQVVLRAVENCRPLMDVLQRKAGTKIMYVPKVLKPEQSTRFAIKWILQAASKRRAASSAPMAECLAAELLLAAQRRGGARQKRDELHKLALDNRANLRARG